MSCNYCKKEFKRKPSDISAKNFCSFNCYSLSRAIKNNGICKACGKEFYRSPAHLKRAKNTYCSIKCAGIGESGSGNHMYNRDEKRRICKNCGGLKKIDNRVRFCSKECRHEYWKEHGHPKAKERIKARCGYCGKIVIRIGCHIYKNVYCNRACADKGHSALMIGKGNSNYIHGKANLPYPADWTNAYKEYIRNLYERKCQICKTYEGNKKLHIHHISWDKLDLDLNNLIPLCQSCHRKCHTKKERLSKELLNQLSLLAKEKKQSTILK